MLTVLFADLYVGTVLALHNVCGLRMYPVMPSSMLASQAYVKTILDNCGQHVPHVPRALSAFRGWFESRGYRTTGAARCPHG